MRHVAGRSLRAALAAVAVLAVAGCVPQPPETSATAGGAPSGSSSASSSAAVSRTTPPAPVTSTAPTTSTSSTASSAAATTASASATALGVETLGPLPAVGAAEPPPVLPALSASAPLPTATGLAARLDGLLGAAGLGARVEYEIADAATGQVLLARGETTPATPASTTKLLTAVAALSVLGPQSRLATTVVSGGDGSTLTLVAGGDDLLVTGRGDPAAVVGHAGLTDLADATVAALRAAGRTKVALHLDDSVFTGPRLSPAWLPSDLAFVAPVAPLAVESGRAVEGKPATASDPALAAANAFAGLLGARGITVTGVSRTGAPAGAAVVARVEGAQVADVVEHMLDESDNTVAEVLARLVAVRTGLPGSFDGAGKAVVAAVTKLGVPTDGARFTGGSGLARGGVIPPRTLAATLVLAASDKHPELRATLTGLPVAGVTGTLADRFSGAAQGRAAGLVRAKTGTLTGASSLAGTVVDADGRLLVFAVVADRVTSTAAARTALDSVTTALAGCGCR